MRFCNGSGWMLGCALAALGLGLAGCNSAPVALDDQVSVPVGATSNIDVLANDTDPDADPLIVKRAWGAEKGTVTINADNTIAYAANSGASGNDVFRYRIKDHRGKAAEAQVLVDLDRPVALRDREGLVLGTTSDPVLIAEPRAVVVPDAVVVRKPDTYVVTPAPSPMLDSMLVTLHTMDDDKNRDESVRIIVRRGTEVLAETTAGSGELWGNNSERSFELDLRPDVKLSEVGQLSVDVVKSATGSGTGGGWIFRPEVMGRLDDGNLVTILESNKAVKLGDGQPKDVSISIPFR